MLGITKAISVARSVEDCFLYLSDVRKLIEWDPAVSATRKDSLGPVAKGSYFTVRVAIGVLSLRFRYIITEHTSSRRIVIAGRSMFLNVNDTIELSEADGHTAISYHAEFHFKFGLGRLIPGLAEALDRQCQLAIDGLESALTRLADEATLSQRNAKADAKKGSGRQPMPVHLQRRIKASFAIDHRQCDERRARAAACRPGCARARAAPRSRRAQCLRSPGVFPGLYAPRARRALRSARCGGGPRQRP